jgi:hypothetical protein
MPRLVSSLSNRLVIIKNISDAFSFSAMPMCAGHFLSRANDTRRRYLLMYNRRILFLLECEICFFLFQNLKCARARFKKEKK